jgi:hypothetical protein
MANENDLNARLQQGSEQVREQIRGAIDSYFGFLSQSVASMPSGGSEFTDKMKTFAEKNIAATHRFLTEVSQAKDFAELMSLQNEFMQAQFLRNSPGTYRVWGKHTPNQQAVRRRGLVRSIRRANRAIGGRPQNASAGGCIFTNRIARSRTQVRCLVTRHPFPSRSAMHATGPFVRLGGLPCLETTASIPAGDLIRHSTS